jgi:dTDP-4-dehydrorhamnose 3,5-epimerase
MVFLASETRFKGLHIINPFSHLDPRGCFTRLFSANDLKSFNLDLSISQVNYSTSAQVGTIRGIHYQLPPCAETKMIKVISGAIFDVAIDLRANSNTFMETHCIELNSSGSQMLYIPQGFAHGMQSLEPNTEVIYFSSKPHSPSYEKVIRWNDPAFAIEWPIRHPILSDKDKMASDFSAALATLHET